MARGGKRVGSGRKPTGTRVAVLVRLDRDLEEKISHLRNGKSMSSTVEQLLKMAVKNVASDEDDAANTALGFVLSQAANAASWQDRTWQTDPATKKALQLALPHIVELLAPADPSETLPSHPFYKSVDEHARMIFSWIVRRMSERGDEYEDARSRLLDGKGWPSGHPLRNFPRAAAALNFKGLPTKDEGGDQ